MRRAEATGRRDRRSASLSPLAPSLKIDNERSDNEGVGHLKCSDLAAHEPLALVTIGYEKRTLEGYLGELVSARVTLLCDVRRNPLSRKRGFSKRALAAACLGLGIRYEHLPELGIESDRRRGLSERAEFEALFREYRRLDLVRANAKGALDQIAEWLRQGQCVALTCYERHTADCHRHCVAEALQQRTAAVPRDL